FGDLLSLFFSLLRQRPVSIFFVPGCSSFDGNAVAKNVDFHYSFLSKSAIFLIERIACSILRRSFRRPFSGFKLISSSVSFMRESVGFPTRESLVVPFPAVWISLRKSISWTISR